PGVAQHRLRPGGRDDDARIALAVPDRDELALVLLVIDLDVGQRRLTARAPVDDALGTVDELVVVQLLEDREDGAGEPLVHREALTRPVDAVAQTTHLIEDLAAVLRLPPPDPLDELLPREV